MKKYKINNKILLFIILIILLICNNIYASDSISIYSNHNIREEPKIKIKYEELNLLTIDFFI